MKNRFNIIVCFLIIMAFNWTPVFSQTGKFDLDQTKRILTAEIRKALTSGGGASISIALVKDGKIVWNAAFGYSNLKTKTLSSTGTIYNTGSTFKPVTATAIMQLAEQGKIRLDDPVYRYLDRKITKNWGTREKSVTFRHILTHRSGFAPDVVGRNHVVIWGRGVKPLSTLEEDALKLHSLHAPGETYEYNNLAFGLLGLLIEKVTGKKYEEYMVHHVFKPLGIGITNPVFPTPEMVEMMAFPYVRGADNKLEPAQQIQYTFYPAGDIYLTCEDMARFIAAHLNGGMFKGRRILGEEFVKEMHTLQFGGTYGLGFKIHKDDKGHTILSHTGKTDNGFSSVMLCDLDSRVGAYMMSNFSDGSLILDLTVAITLLRGDYIPPGERKTIALAPRILDRYVGDYQIQDIVMKVLRKGNHLFIKSPFGSEPARLYAASETTFFVMDEAYTSDITFIMNNEKVVEQMVIVWQGQKIPLKKVKKDLERKK